MPNASVESKPLNVMSCTSQITEGLLLSNSTNTGPASSAIYVSPLIRAKETAAKIIPQGFHGNIEETPVIAETKEGVSGSGARSKKELEDEYKNIKFWDTPFIKITYWIALKICSENYFKKIQNKNTAINFELNRNYPNSTITTTTQTSHDDSAKFQDISNLIHNNQTDKNIWFIAHGKISAGYLKEHYHVDARFTFGDTKSIYLYTNQHQEQKFFCPPYSLIIDQKTGLIKGKMGLKRYSLLDNIQDFVKSGINKIKLFAKKHPILFGIMVGLAAVAVTTAIITIIVHTGGLALLAPAVSAHLTHFGVVVAAKVGVSLAATSSAAPIVGASVFAGLASATGAFFGAIGGVIANGFMEMKNAKSKIANTPSNQTNPTSPAPNVGGGSTSKAAAVIGKPQIDGSTSKKAQTEKSNNSYGGKPLLVPCSDSDDERDNKDKNTVITQQPFSLSPKT